MFGFAWLAIRQAREALKQGRLEEAHRLLIQPAIRDHRATGELLARLVRAYVERGERHLKLEDAESAWRDLLQAEQLQIAEKSVDRLRQALIRLGLAEVRALLHAGEIRRADEAIAHLRERRVRSAELQVLEEAARDWLQARELADHGEFASARDAVERVRRRLPDRPVVLDRFAADLDHHRKIFPGLLVRLHEAADTGKWREVIELGEQVLALAPQHAEARKARMRAWKAIEPVTVALPGPDASTEGETLPCDSLPTRFLLWIDGVGGYLVCLGSRMTFGQAIHDGHVDIPLVADVSRLHASLTRDAEGYVLEAVRPIQVNGREAMRALLQNGDRITLGASCQLQFRLPVPISTSARLDLVSGHRLPLSVDAILLMADTLVLGDGPQVHVSVPDLKQPIVLFRQKDTLGIRHGGKLYVNGHTSGERLLLSDLHAMVSGENISFAIEPVAVRLG
ncbi:MAG TPA: FHA domain-containing protein [Gemmataceae bacterium]|nr:FHA domain-containing protein [Gemmataceae bacterium]